MSEHRHPRYVEGCARCALSRDEAAADCICHEGSVCSSACRHSHHDGCLPLKEKTLVQHIREGYRCEQPVPEERGYGTTEWMGCGGCWPCLAIQAANRIEELEPMTAMTTLDAYREQRQRADELEAERKRLLAEVRAVFVPADTTGHNEDNFLPATDAPIYLPALRAALKEDTGTEARKTYRDARGVLPRTGESSEAAVRRMRDGDAASALIEEEG